MATPACVSRLYVHAQRHEHAPAPQWKARLGKAGVDVQIPVGGGAGLVFAENHRTLALILRVQMRWRTIVLRHNELPAANICWHRLPEELM